MATSKSMPKQPAVRLGARFEDGVSYARELHADDVRKSTSIPYLSHPLSVAALVIEDGATDEDLVIGALLHDAAEDHGGRAQLEKIRERFGDGVATIVQGCTDTLEDPRPDWRLRKEIYLTHLRPAVEARAPFVSVSLADKLHNARSILADVRELGVSMFERFNGGHDGTLWYYRSLLTAFEGYPSRMVGELERVVAEIDSLSSG